MSTPPLAVTAASLSTSQKTEFEKQFAAIFKTAYSVAFRFSGQSDDASDLVQEAAIRAFKAFDSFDSFEPNSNFKAWFLRILVNCFLNHRRKNERTPQTTDIEECEDLFLYRHARQNHLLARGGDPSTQLLARFDDQLVNAALKALPEEFRLVAIFYFGEELSYEEISTIAECPLGTVRSRLHRGRKLLQKSSWQLAIERGLISPTK